MSNVMQCDIVTPEKSIFSGEVSFVALPSVTGEVGVLAQHAPLLTILGSGEVRLKDAEGAKLGTYAIAGGYAEVDGKRVIILADHARNVKEIDRAIIEDRISSLTQELTEVEPEGDRAAFLQEELDWCLVQQRVISR